MFYINLTCWSLYWQPQGQMLGLFLYHHIILVPLLLLYSYLLFKFCCILISSYLGHITYVLYKPDLLEALLAASRANAGASKRDEEIGEFGHLTTLNIISLFCPHGILILFFIGIEYHFSFSSTLNINSLFCLHFWSQIGIIFTFLELMVTFQNMSWRASPTECFSRGRMVQEAP